jgi:hypothetical protein
MSSIRRIAINTGGGDAPGLNAVIRAAAIAAANRGWECYGIREGFNGILFPERYAEGGVIRLTRDRVRGIAHLGGTILGTTNKGNPIHFPLRMPDGTVKEVDRSGEILDFFAKKEIDALISIGGDGSLTIANALAQRGLRVVGVPKTIDNDLDKTATTFGFDTAVAFATECLDRLHSTAESHQRIQLLAGKELEDFIGAIHFPHGAIGHLDGELQGIALVGGAQNGAAQVGNAAHPLAREWHHTALGIGLRLQDAIEAVAQAHAFPAAVGGGRDGRADDRIEAGRITSAGADGDTSNGLVHKNLPLTQRRFASARVSYQWPQPSD